MLICIQQEYITLHTRTYVRMLAYIFKQYLNASTAIHYCQTKLSSNLFIIYQILRGFSDKVAWAYLIYNFPFTTTHPSPPPPFQHKDIKGASEENNLYRDPEIGQR